MDSFITYGGRQVKFEKQLYGNRTVTFASVQIGKDRWASLGDPVEGNSWSEAHLHASMESVLGTPVEAPNDAGFDDIAELVRGFLRGAGLSPGGLIFYTKDEWKVSMADPHGTEELLAAINIDDSPLYDVINQTRAGAAPQLEKFIATLEEAGYRFEPMQAWAIAIYRL